MTAKGEGSTYVAENPNAWQPHDVIIHNEVVDDEDHPKPYLYRVITVPALHTDVTSDDDIECEYLIESKWKGHRVYKPSGQKWVFKSNSLTSVDRGAYTIEKGKMRNKKQLIISFDLESYWDNLHSRSTVSA